jgi:chromate reductase, NAD(P)H dehydrogenase (quinone)
MRVLAICGSLQSQSSNLRAIRAAVTLAPEGMTVTVFEGLARLPHFNPDLEREQTLAEVVEFRAALIACDALLIACPEYGHSLPGVLKNAIDWVIGSGELEEKLVATMAITPAPERGLRGLAALAGTLNAVRARIVGGEPIVRGQQQDGVRALLTTLLDAYRAPREA